MTIQARFEGRSYVYHYGRSENQLANLWRRSQAVIMWNAPYDLGVLSTMPGNSGEWRERGKGDFKVSNWLFSLYGGEYTVKRITPFRNLIKPRNAPPVIDLLKLWSLLIDDGEHEYPEGQPAGIGLKAVAYRELGIKMIPWSEENAKTREYQLQDVEVLEKLYVLFTERIQAVPDVAGMSLIELADIKTPASFSKLMYKKHYPELKEWKEHNDDQDKTAKLGGALEKAYHGGITLSLYRGRLRNVGWVDIKGAYATAIVSLNTDRYLKYEWQRAGELSESKPQLVKARSNFLMKTINGGLKLFATRKLCVNWIWNYDIQALQNLYPAYRFEILEIYEPMPLIDIEKSLPVEWIRKKNDSKKGSTLYHWYKYCTNTSYGIKAQRKPFPTTHTNLVIAGIITSRVHLCLSQIIKALGEQGFTNIYNDTDSCGFTASDGYDSKPVVNYINERIYPFEVEHDGFYKDADFMSLKRYVCVHGDKNDKIRVHGRGRYDVSSRDIMRFVRTRTTDEPTATLTLRQLSANTPLTLKMISKLYRDSGLYVYDHGQLYSAADLFERYKHPFCFIRDIPTKRTKEEFLRKWFYHIDVKTTWEKTTGAGFGRKFHEFSDDNVAVRCFEHFSKSDDDESSDKEKRDWDAELKADFDI